MFRRKKALVGIYEEIENSLSIFASGRFYSRQRLITRQNCSRRL